MARAGAVGALLWAALVRIPLYVVFPFQVLLRCGAVLISGENTVATMLGINSIASRKVVERAGMGTWVAFSLNVCRELANLTAGRLRIEAVTGLPGRQVAGGITEGMSTRQSRIIDALYCCRTYRSCVSVYGQSYPIVFLSPASQRCSFSLLGDSTRSPDRYRCHLRQ
jgi:hypothetical protein